MDVEIQMKSMDLEQREKPHAVCVPFPAQGHIAPMLKLAKLIHSNGFHITFVNTDYNHNRLLNSQGPAGLLGTDDFQFATIPDGLPPSGDLNCTQDIPSLCTSTSTTCLPPFLHLLHKLNQQKPRVSCIVSSAFMTFTLDAAKELAIPITFLCTTSACGYLCYFHYQHLIDQGLVPLKNDQGCLTDGYLDTPIPWLPGMKKDMRLRDFPTFVRTTNPDDILLNFTSSEARRAAQGSAIIINTFDELERPVLDAVRSLLSTPVYSIGPLSLLSGHIPDGPVSSLGSSLWTEDTTCLDWLDLRDGASVLYVNFGSVTVMSKEELVEFAWGLANSKLDFLWVLRADLVREKPGVVMQEFLEETKERGMVASWCPQEAVLAHPAVGGFLTHSGWNSTLESIAGGVPMLSWPFLAEQPTNCKFVCGEWGIGMEIGSSVKRGEVEMLVRELMVREKGMEMRKKAMEWKESARRACDVGGSSFLNLQRVLVDVLLATTPQ